MITRVINADFEPINPLSIRRSDGKVFIQDASIDTGFSDWLSQPPDLIAELNLRWKRRERAILCDGSVVFLHYQLPIPHSPFSITRRSVSKFLMLGYRVDDDSDRY